ncbi:MAG: sigma-70 family RNA polymerase sigma factor [Thermoanaerobaculia bacterium]
MLEALATPDALSAAATPPAALEDARLLGGLRRGEARAFEALYRRHAGQVFGLALRLTSKRAEAEDLAQEVFTRAWENRGAFQSLEHFVHWLRQVAVRQWINQLRRRRELELDAPGEDGEPAPEPASPPVAAPALRLDLERALAELTPRLRAVLLLFDLYGMRHEEIGELLDMTPGASKVQLHRARRRLREVLQ